MYAVAGVRPGITAFGMVAATTLDDPVQRTSYSEAPREVSHSSVTEVPVTLNVRTPVGAGGAAAAVAGRAAMIEVTAAVRTRDVCHPIRVRPFGHATAPRCAEHWRRATIVNKLA
ncbi:hypothetical protein AOZ06_32670 [Kibdelosporangium phytohabitans]|uniref:Uncharacterized protein n=1 Tax=Kibdelosporangium phytohabitans TaxID=860235 RepID=A0A0N9I933_9PSEU|nr:hypothetical protein AOZ06_32670 [Kibdelosporangium phytohabitans]